MTAPLVPGPQYRARRRPRRPSPSPLIYPFLAAWERLDRWRRRIRHLRPDALLGFELARHRGRVVVLADGTRVRPGDPIARVHLRNPLVASLVEGDWLTAGFREARNDLRRFAAWARSQPPGKRPVAWRGTSILWPLARRAGFEVRTRRRTAWARLEDWHFRSLMARWGLRGRARLERGHNPLRSAEAWLSGAELERRYGDLLAESDRSAAARRP